MQSSCEVNQKSNKNERLSCSEKKKKKKKKKRKRQAYPHQLSSDLLRVLILLLIMKAKLMSSKHLASRFSK